MAKQRLAKSNTLPFNEMPSFSHCELKFFNVLQITHYTFQTFEEASQLAYKIARLYPVRNKHHVELGLIEIFINAIEHGHLGITLEEKYKLKANNQWDEEINKRLQEPHNQNKKALVRVEMTPSYLLIQVTDQGAGFNWRQHENEPIATSFMQNGRGLFLARELSFDKIEFSSVGNQVSCFIYHNI